MLDAALTAARLLHYAGALVLFGAALFPFYSFKGAPWPDQFVRWRRNVLVVSALAALVGGTLWLLFTAGVMGGSFASIIDPQTIGAVLTETDFGPLWALRLALCLILLWLAFAGATRSSWFCVLAALLLASIAGVGHTRVQEGAAGALHIAGDAAHLLAAGVWLGALLPLGWMTMRMSGAPEAEAALRRFSGIGQIAVAVLIASGVSNAVFLLADPASLITTTYGRLLVLKLVLFGAMLALAAFNRLVLVPQLRHQASSVVFARLRVHILGEQALALAVVAIVSVLGLIDPSAA